jgi:hypothetical protein
MQEIQSLSTCFSACQNEVISCSMGK